MQHANTLSLTSETKWSVDNDQFKWSFRFMKTLSFSIEKRWSKLHFAIESFNLPHFALVLHILCDNLTFCEWNPAIFKYSMSLSTENTIESFKWVFKWYVRSFDQFNVFFFCLIFLCVDSFAILSHHLHQLWKPFNFHFIRIWCRLSHFTNMHINCCIYYYCSTKEGERERENRKKMQHFVRRFVKWR